MNARKKITVEQAVEALLHLETGSISQQALTQWRIALGNDLETLATMVRIVAMIARCPILVAAEAIGVSASDSAEGVRAYPPDSDSLKAWEPLMTGALLLLRSTSRHKLT